MRMLRRIEYWLRRNREAAALEEELAFHEALIRESLGDAAQARRSMGPATLMREDARAVWIWPWLESCGRDLGYALRSFRRQPGFTLVAVIALALAIGLNTSLFTVFNATALRPWAVPDPGRVVNIFRFVKSPPKGWDNVNGISLGEARYLAQNSKTLSGLFVSRRDAPLHLENGTARAEYVTSPAFQVLALRMARGRGFLPEEDNVDSPQAVAVLSYSAWRNRYAGDEEILGRRVSLDGVPFTIVGVTPPEFWGIEPETTDFWIPLSSMLLLHANDPTAVDYLRQARSCCVSAAGRLGPGVTREQAQAELSVLSASYAGNAHESSDGIVLAGTPLLQRPGQKRNQILAIIGLMFGAVLLVLLLACANVGNLLLARAVARRREIGIRLSMGAGRGRLIRQLMTESLALACMAGAIGIAIAFVVPGPVFRLAMGETTLAMKPDGTVLVFTIGMAVIACLAFGLAPALQATRGDLSDAFRERYRSASRLGLRSTLLAVQVAISVVLLASAGLMTRGLGRVYTRDPGFAVEGNAVVTFDFPASGYGKARWAGFYRDLAQGLDRYPGSEPYGLAVFEPLSNSRRFTGFHLPGDSPQSTTVILFNHVSAGYFDALHLRILQGRNFQPGDDEAGSLIVNQAMADKYFPGQSAIGKSIVIDKAYPIVGVIPNAYLWGMDKVDPMLFAPIPYIEPARLIIRNKPANLAAVEAVTKNVDARVHIQVSSISASLDRWLSTSRVSAWIAAVMGLLALVMAAIGVSGVFAYSVQQRTREIGVRIALGASPSQVTGVVLGWAARSLAIGAGVGVLGAIAVAQVLRQYLFGLSGLDPVTYAGVLLTLVLAGMLAARRAVRLDPVRALRCD